MGDVEHELAELTDRVIAYRVIRRMGMDRVTEKLKQAAGVVARSNTALEAEADRLIAREGDFEKRKQQAFAPHYAVLDARHREMDQLEDALKIVSNADPLQSSQDGSQEVEPQPGFQPDVQLRPDPSGVQGQSVPAVQQNAAAPRPASAVLDQAMIVDHLIGEKAAG